MAFRRIRRSFHLSVFADEEATEWNREISSNLLSRAAKRYFKSKTDLPSVSPIQCFCLDFFIENCVVELIRDETGDSVRLTDKFKHKTHNAQEY